eukprot:11815447-Alexandrium_andersonii.AAC.1
MSASLVGSEMCIRDRRSFEGPQGNPQTDPRKPAVTSQRAAEQHLASPESESARTAAQNAPLGSFRDQVRGHCWARAIQAPNALS